LAKFYHDYEVIPVAIIISVDDTDQLSTKGIKGTGDVAQGMAAAIEQNRWGTVERVTRHQLLLHKDIPYTSHNSSMCFKAHLYDEVSLAEVIGFCSRYLEQESESESDPGLCIVDLDRLAEPDRLVAFGYEAKRVVLTMQQAEELARELGVHLSRHGGTGQGIIGALAGAGLRLSGNDGAFKDRHRLGEPGTETTAAELCRLAAVDRVGSMDGRFLEGGEVVVLGRMVKSILSQGMAVIPVEPLDSATDGQKRWITCSKEQIHRKQGGRA